MVSNKKLKAGFFSFTCCEGCIICFIEILNKKYFEYIEKIDIQYLKALKKVKPLKSIDIAFVEGAIATKEEEIKLMQIRKHAKKVVALGSGAITGWPSNLRNEFKGKKLENIQALIKKVRQNEKILPIKNFIRVDDEIPGCPVDEKLFIKKIEGYLNR